MLSPKVIQKQTTLLLDFDGVILKHPPVLKKIQTRVVEYVQKNVNQGYLSMEDANRLNRDLYTRHGHTHLGMKKLFLPYSKLSSFNEYVYQPAFLQQLYHEYLTDEALHDDIQAFKKWIVSFEEKTGIPTYIFTNSPSHWCEMWLMPHRNMTHVKGIQAIFGSNHAMFQTTDDALLKPNLVLYRRMESYFSTQSDTLVFVDDSRSNLEPIASRPMWHPILFDSENASTPTSTPTTLPSIQHLSQLDASILV